MYQIDMKFDRHLRAATETSLVVSYGGKTFPRWRTAAILKVVISPYLSEKSSDFGDILYTAADFKLDERHVIKNEKVALDRLRVRQNVFLVINIFCFATSLNRYLSASSQCALYGRNALDGFMSLYDHHIPAFLFLPPPTDPSITSRQHTP